MKYTRQYHNALRKEEMIKAGIAKGRPKELIARDARVCIDTLKTYCRLLGITLPDYTPAGPRKPRTRASSVNELAFWINTPTKRSKKRRSWWRRFLELFS